MYILILLAFLVALSSHGLFAAGDGLDGRRAPNAAGNEERRPAGKVADKAGDDDSSRERISAGNRKHQGRR